MISKYKKSHNRLIFLDYEGTLVKSEKYSYINKEKSSEFIKINSKPQAAAMESLKKLASDCKNKIFIITGKRTSFLDSWFSDIKGLGLGSEYGYLYKVNEIHKEWQRLFKIKDWSWKQKVVNEIQNFVDKIEESYMEIKESGVVWKFEYVNKEFAKIQGKKLINQLNKILVQNREIEIIEGNNYIEVKPKGINKVIMFIYLFLQ